MFIKSVISIYHLRVYLHHDNLCASCYFYPHGTTQKIYHGYPFVYMTPGLVLPCHQSRPDLESFSFGPPKMAHTSDTYIPAVNTDTAINVGYPCRPLKIDANVGEWVAWFASCVKRCDSVNVNTLRPRQDGRHFADDIFTCNFFNENCCILIKFSLKYVRKGPIDNNAALVQIMAWRRSGDKPLSEPIIISLPTHICVTRPQWVNNGRTCSYVR